MTRLFLILHEKDNVATVLKEIPEGTEIEIEKDNEKFLIKTNKKIPIYHKIALKDIKIGEEVLKYGEVIGIAKKEIKQGDHVHRKNIRSVFA
ncbi:MAG: UxaA family hydrolase [Candidatus Helarchaeota archaeon]